MVSIALFRISLILDVPCLGAQNLSSERPDASTFGLRRPFSTFVASWGTVGAAGRKLGGPESVFL